MKTLNVLFCCLALPAAALDDAAPARENEARVWQAISGDEAVLDGERVRLAGIACPDPETEEGRRAKALFNTFLRGGRVTCNIRDGWAQCDKEGRDVATGLIESGLCRAIPMPALEEETARILTRDPTQEAEMISGRTASCDPAANADRFISSARQQACSDGGFAGLCTGRNGAVRNGVPVAGSDRYRATGDGAPSYRPFDCD